MRKATVGDACMTLLDDQIEIERDRKVSLEGRGIAVITTSGTLVTLLLGLAAVITNVEGFSLAPGPRVLLIVALGTFLSAAVLGIYCNVPLKYAEIESDSLQTLTSQEVWTQPGYEAEREIAVAKLGSLTTAKHVNENKARVLMVAAAAEVLAVALTGVAAALILAHG